MNLDTGLSAGVGVLPVIVGDSALATKLSERLFQHGGIVHGGVYVLLSESAASTAAMS